MDADTGTSVKPRPGGVQFSLRSLLIMIAILAVAFAIAVPAYRRSISPPLEDQRAVVVKSNTTFPVVSMRVFTSGLHGDRARILVLHRRTKAAVGDWEPQWLESGRTDDGKITCVVNGDRVYPPDDSRLTLIYATDDDDPIEIRVAYQRYAELPWNDTAVLWEKLVDDNLKAGEKGNSNHSSPQE